MAEPKGVRTTIDQEIRENTNGRGGEGDIDGLSIEDSSKGGRSMYSLQRAVAFLTKRGVFAGPPIIPRKVAKAKLNLRIVQSNVSSRKEGELVGETPVNTQKSQRFVRNRMMARCARVEQGGLTRREASWCEKVVRPSEKKELAGVWWLT